MAPFALAVDGSASESLVARPAYRRRLSYDSSPIRPRADGLVTVRRTQGPRSRVNDLLVPLRELPSESGGRFVDAMISETRERAKACAGCGDHFCGPDSWDGDRPGTYRVGTTRHQAFGVWVPVPAPGGAGTGCQEAPPHSEFWPRAGRWKWRDRFAMFTASPRAALCRVLPLTFVLLFHNQRLR